MSIPLWLQCTIFWCTSSRIMHHHKDQIISDWFLEHDNEFTLLKWPPQSNQITFIVTSPQHKCLGEWNSYERAPDSEKNKNKLHMDSTHLQTVQKTMCKIHIHILSHQISHQISHQSPDLNPIEHLWDVVEREILIMDVQTTNLQQLLDAIMSIWSKISEECFQHLVESMPRRIKAVLKEKGGPTRY